MKSVDDISKIKAAVLYIINKTGEIDFIKLFKLIYFAQQQYLVKYGRPIIKETFCALTYGPVPSFTYKALQCALGTQQSTADIEDFNSNLTESNRDGINYISSSSAPDNDELALAEQQCLDAVIDKFASLDGKKLSQLSHKDVAWRDASARTKEDPEKDRISLIDIAKSGGADKDTIDYIREMQLLHKLYQA
jgi:uncharacterized phage-associated protein